MGNRIIKESICISYSLDQLSWFEEVLFYRLIVNCDDYGRCDARTSVLKGKLFPLKTDIREKHIAEAIHKLELVGIVQCYTVNQRPYLQLLSWNRHQTVRAKKSKFPGPEEADGVPIIGNLQTSEINCNQLITVAVPIQSNPIQSNSIQSNSSLLLGANSAPSQPTAIFSLPLNDKTLYPITEAQVREWSALYPAVDVMQQLRQMLGWCNSNPRKCKTKSGILRFINRWLSKEQNNGGTTTQSNAKKQVQSNYEHESSFIGGI